MLEQHNETITNEPLDKVDQFDQELSFPTYLFLLTEKEKQILNHYIKSTFHGDPE